MLPEMINVVGRAVLNVTVVSDPGKLMTLIDVGPGTVETIVLPERVKVVVRMLLKVVVVRDPDKVRTLVDVGPWTVDVIVLPEMVKVVVVGRAVLRVRVVSDVDGRITVVVEVWTVS